jgi:hypothetical protein
MEGRPILEVKKLAGETADAFCAILLCEIGCHDELRDRALEEHGFQVQRRHHDHEASILPHKARLVVLDGRGMSPSRFDAALAGLLVETAAADQADLVVVICDDQLDVAAARLLGTRAAIMCRPARADWNFVLEGLKGRGVSQLGDKGSEREAERIRRLNGQAELMVERSEAQAQEPDERGAEAEPREINATYVIAAADVRSVIKARRLREEVFPGGLLSDPAWDMLLDLLASGLEVKQVSVSSLCIASRAPPTTALRWVNILEQQRLIERRPDPHDKRRSFMSLSRKGRLAMAEYFAALKRANLPLV